MVDASSQVNSGSDPEAIWTHVVDRARSELTETSISMWFTGVRAVGLHDGVFEVAAPSTYVRDWLARHHLRLIEGAIVEATGQEQIRVVLTADEEAEQAVAAAAPPSTDGTAALQPTGPTTDPVERLGAPGLPFPGYTFDAFVPGPSNRFAHAAAMAVAEAPPSKAYNPLFIYGGVGLGKTHLLVAIGHHMHRLNNRLRVKYVTSEAFVTEFVKAVRERQGYQFQQRYREVDVLLVDDIQFLAKREETQTEFFHTFNHLHLAERQIVIASDRAPQDLSGMEERLKNRFRWGLCVDVQPPDLETRLAILQLKAQRDDIRVPDEVLDFIASRFDQSVRELEGALVRVVAFSELTGQAIDVLLAERALQDLLPQTVAEIAPETILDEVATYFGLSRDDLVSPSRSRPLTNARHIAMYLIRECTGLSLVKIGEIFGGRDHSTALYGINQVEKKMRARDTTYKQVQDLSRIIRGRARATGN
ncbi:MAG: chromosomal replication initiator protein DnaA [Actinomycetota bacterium]